MVSIILKIDKFISNKFLLIRKFRTFKIVFLLLIKKKYNIFIYTEKILTAINRWAEKSGVNLITCIGQSNENIDNALKTRNLIALSNQMGYNTSWQLGYGKKNNISQKIIFPYVEKRNFSF